MLGAFFLILSITPDRFLVGLGGEDDEEVSVTVMRGIRRRTSPRTFAVTFRGPGSTTWIVRMPGGYAVFWKKRWT